MRQCDAGCAVPSAAVPDSRPRSKLSRRTDRIAIGGEQSTARSADQACGRFQAPRCTVHSFRRLRVNGRTRVPSAPVSSELARSRSKPLNLCSVDAGAGDGICVGGGPGTAGCSRHNQGTMSRSHHLLPSQCRTEPGQYLLAFHGCWCPGPGRRGRRYVPSARRAHQQPGRILGQSRTVVYSRDRSLDEVLRVRLCQRGDHDFRPHVLVRAVECRPTTLLTRRSRKPATFCWALSPWGSAHWPCSGSLSLLLRTPR